MSREALAAAIEAFNKLKAATQDTETHKEALRKAIMQLTPDELPEYIEATMED